MLTTIDQPVQAHLLVPAYRLEPMSAILRYRSDDPLAVHLVFPSSEPARHAAESEWVFARELLNSGLRAPSGAGDVHVWPCGPQEVMVELHAGPGLAMVLIPREGAEVFLRHAYHLVPVAEESRHLNLEHGLAAILAEG